MQPQGGGNEGTGSHVGVSISITTELFTLFRKQENLHRGHCQSRQTLTSARRLCQHHPRPRLNGAEETRGLSGSEAPQISCQKVAESAQDCVRQRSGSRVVGKRAADAPDLCSCCVTTILPEPRCTPVCSQILRSKRTHSHEISLSYSCGTDASSYTNPHSQGTHRPLFLPPPQGGRDTGKQAGTVARAPPLEPE